MNLEVIKSLLEDTRINVTTAESGRECLNILSGETFDVIFLDQMMPGMSGVRTLEEIRKQDLAKGTPVIALTADAILGARDSYIREGFTDYLSKPVMYADLESLLHKYLKRDLILTSEQIAALDAAGDSEENKPVILVINESKEKLNSLKARASDGFRWVYVRDEESARKYMEKHHADYNLR